jgi:hypothetical protein
MKKIRKSLTSYIGRHDPTRRHVVPAWIHTTETQQISGGLGLLPRSILQGRNSLAEA